MAAGVVIMPTILARPWVLAVAPTSSSRDLLVTISEVQEGEPMLLVSAFHLPQT